MRFYWQFCRLIAFFFAILLVKARGYGLRHVPRTGSVLLACNHQSFMDPILVSMLLNREGNYMARHTVFVGRWLKWFFGSLNTFPVRRQTADLGAIKEALRRLKAGKLLVLFPEGTRSYDGQIGPMLPGLSGIAKKAKVPIIPTLVDGMIQAWPRTQLLPRSGNVIVEYGQPIMPEDYAEWSSGELTGEIRRQLIAMQQRWHDRLPERRLPWYKSRTIT